MRCRRMVWYCAYQGCRGGEMC